MQIFIYSRVRWPVVGIFKATCGLLDFIFSSHHCQWGAVNFNLSVSFSHSTEVRTFDCVSCCFKHFERRVLLKFSISTRWLSRCARSDWSRIASYLAIIISHGVILAGVLNSKMAVPRFFNVSEEVINAKEENSIWKSTKDVTEFDGTLFKSRMWIFCWLNKINLLKLSVYLDTSDQQNYNKTCEIFSSFTTEFESTWAIMLKQVFASGSVTIVEYFPRRIFNTFTEP